jgi:hypothetical protein
MYVQQWQSDGPALSVCGVAVDSQAVAAKVRRVLVAAYLLGVIQVATGAMDFYRARGYLALIPVAIGLLVIGFSHVGARERNTGLMGCYVCLNCVSMLLVVMSLGSAGFGYLAFNGETIEVEACCSTLEQCGWAPTDCACNASLAGGRYTLELVPPPAGASCNSTGGGGGGGGRHGRHREAAAGPRCLDKHGCDVLEYEVGHPFMMVYLPFVVALLPCLPAICGCCLGASLCRDGGHVKGLGAAYMSAPMGTSTNAASYASVTEPVTPTHAVARPATGAVQAANPYPTMTRQQQQQQQQARDYRGYRSPREDTIGL